jgi:hypothetical protein
MATLVKQPLPDGGEVIINVDNVVYVRKEPKDNTFVCSLKTVDSPFPIAIPIDVYNVYASLVPTVG